MNKIEYAKINWPKVSDERKASLQKQRDENIKKAVDDFVEKYLNEQEFTDHYKGNFGKVKKEVKTLLNDVSDVSTNYYFFQTVEKLLVEKRGTKDGFTYWKKQEFARLKKSSGVKRIDFDKLPQADRNKAKATSIEKYEQSLKAARAEYPQHELPAFLMLDVDEDSEVYKVHWKRWIKLRRELKEYKTWRKADFKRRAEVKEKVVEERVALRKKYGFIKDSHKIALTAYMLFSAQTRAQFPNKTLTIQQIAKLWSTTPEAQKTAYQMRINTEMKKREVMNKSAVQQVIKSGNFFALSKSEAKSNLNDEQMKQYKKDVDTVRSKYYGIVTSSRYPDLKRPETSKQKKQETED